MSTAKVAVSIDRRLLGRLDRLVKGKAFANRSQAVQTAVREKVESLEHTLLARECAKLDPKEEQAEADMGLAEDLNEWPEY